MLSYILITFLFLLVLLSPVSIMASDYLDALDFSMTPEENSQYWVAPFVVEFIEKHKDLLGETSFEYLRTVTLMSLMLPLFLGAYSVTLRNTLLCYAFCKPAYRQSSCSMKWMFVLHGAMQLFQS